jgi:homoserine O-acetyltransferase/O-succinyltransferase
MPSATDLYFPVADAQYESQYIPHCTLLPIPSLWVNPSRPEAALAELRFHKSLSSATAR